MSFQSLSVVPKKREIVFPEIPSKVVWWSVSVLMKLHFFLDFCKWREIQAEHSAIQPLLGWPFLEDLPLHIISRLVISQLCLGIFHSWRPRFLKLFSAGALVSCARLPGCLRQWILFKVMNFSKLWGLRPYHFKWKQSWEDKFTVVNSISRKWYIKAIGIKISLIFSSDLRTVYIRLRSFW